MNMSLIRKFEDYILYSPIFELAFQRRICIDKIRGTSFTLFYHILKVKLMEECKNLIIDISDCVAKNDLKRIKEIVYNL